MSILIICLTSKVSIYNRHYNESMEIIIYIIYLDSKILVVVAVNVVHIIVNYISYYMYISLNEDIWNIIITSQGHNILIWIYVDLQYKKPCIYKAIYIWAAARLLKFWIIAPVVTFLIESYTKSSLLICMKWTSSTLCLDSAECVHEY